MELVLQYINICCQTILNMVSFKPLMLTLLMSKSNANVVDDTFNMTLMKYYALVSLDDSDTSILWFCIKAIQIGCLKSKENCSVNVPTVLWLNIVYSSVGF